MANTQEFNQYTTNTHSLLFDGYMTYNPGQPPVIQPDMVIAIGSAGSVTFRTDGLVELLDGTANAAGTKRLIVDPNRIVRGTVKGAAPAIATAKVVDLQTVNIDYGYSNTNGISAIFVDGWEGRDTDRYKKDYVIQYPAEAALTVAQRTQMLIDLINADPTGKYTAAAITGASGSGSGVAGGGIRLTARKTGTDYQVTAGDGFAPATVVTPSAKEFGTSLFLQQANIPAYAGALTGKTFNTAMFTYEVPIVSANHGFFFGNSVGNNAKLFQEIAVFVFFEVGAGDAALATFDGVLKGTATPASKYNARTSGLGL